MSRPANATMSKCRTGRVPGPCSSFWRSGSRTMTGGVTTKGCGHGLLADSSASGDRGMSGWLWIPGRLLIRHRSPGLCVRCPRRSRRPARSRGCCTSASGIRAACQRQGRAPHPDCLCAGPTPLRLLPRTHDPASRPAASTSTTAQGITICYDMIHQSRD